MDGVNWGVEALKCSTTPRPGRGAERHPDFTDVSIVFAPETEARRIREAIGAAGFHVLGEALSMLGSLGDCPIVWLVRSTQVASLSAIVNAGDQRPGTEGAAK